MNYVGINFMIGAITYKGIFDEITGDIEMSETGGILTPVKAYTLVVTKAAFPTGIAIKTVIKIGAAEYCALGAIHEDDISYTYNLKKTK